MTKQIRNGHVPVFKKKTQLDFLNNIQNQILLQELLCGDWSSFGRTEYGVNHIN